MGRKLDLSGLTDGEAEHVLQVVQRDMQLRKTEETRLTEMKQTLVEEGSRCVLLSQQHRFNERCCIRCCSPFTFLLNPKRCCLDCDYNVCKRCCIQTKKEKGWLCFACQKSRLLKTQSLEWFYNNVRRRFKRFGSATVLKKLYRRHAAEHGVLADLPEGSTYEDSICNEGSVCESDTMFYGQSEEHTVTETISVALRVAEEAIDEAITKAEAQTDLQEKQNEARYLRENRGELVEELATTIVQKIVSRRKDLSAIPSQDNDRTSPPESQTVANASLWRSRSAFSLETNEKAALKTNTMPKSLDHKGIDGEMMREGPVPITALPGWRSVDRLDHSMLQSPDGNWIAYQNTLLSRPSLLTKRKSLVYSALEKESDVVSAYDEMGSETEVEGTGVWGAALMEFRRKTLAKKQSSYESYSRQSTLPLDSRGKEVTAHSFVADTETNSDQDASIPKTIEPILKRKVPLEQRCPSSNFRLGMMDIDLNPGEAESSEDGLEDSRVQRSRRKRKSRRVETEWKGLMDCSSNISDTMVPKDHLKRHTNCDLDAETSDIATPAILSSGAMTPDPFGDDLQDPVSGRVGTCNAMGSLDKELTFKLRELTSQVRETQLSSTEDELDRPENQMWDQEIKTVLEDEVMTDVLGEINENHSCIIARLNETELTSKLIELTSQISEAQFSSTEDELDRYESQDEVVDQPTRSEIQDAADLAGLSERMDGKAEECSLKNQKDILLDISAQNYINEIQISERTDFKGSHILRRIEMNPERHIQTEDRTEVVNYESIVVDGKLNEKMVGRFINDDGKMEFEIVNTVVQAVDDTQDALEAYTNEDDFVDKDEIEKEMQCMNIKQQDYVQKYVSVCAQLEMEAHTKDLEFGSGRPDLLEIELDLNEAVTQKIREKDKQLPIISSDDVQEFCTDSQGATEKEVQKEEDIITQQSPVTQNIPKYLSPQEIYQETNKLHIDKKLNSIFNFPLQEIHKYSAASLRGITTEVLKVLNTTEDLIHGTMRDNRSPSDNRNLGTFPPAQAKRLDEQLSQLEENVYVTAGTVYGLEAELGDLEDCARSVSKSTTERELAHLEDQVASAAALVQQSELQVLDIASRIAALKNAGLNVTPHTSMQTTQTKMQTFSSTRKLRRRLPAPPTQKKEVH